MFYAFTYYTFEISAYENKYENDGYTIEDIREIIGNESNIEVYSEDGTLEILPNPSQNNLTSQEAEPVSLVETPSFEEVKIVDN